MKVGEAKVEGEMRIGGLAAKLHTIDLSMLLYSPIIAWLLLVSSSSASFHFRLYWQSFGVTSLHFFFFNKNCNILPLSTTSQISQNLQAFLSPNGIKSFSSTGIYCQAIGKLCVSQDGSPQEDVVVLQGKTLSSPVQLTPEDIQVIVGLLAEHDTCKMSR